jgi:hypothetical protein
MQLLRRTKDGRDLQQAAPDGGHLLQQLPASRVQHVQRGVFCAQQHRAVECQAAWGAVHQILDRLRQNLRNMWFLYFWHIGHASMRDSGVQRLGFEFLVDEGCIVRCWGGAAHLVVLVVMPKRIQAAVGARQNCGLPAVQPHARALHR